MNIRRRQLTLGGAHTQPGGVIVRMLTIAMLGLGITAFGIERPAPASALDAPASLIVNVYTCDALNDPIDPNETLVNECTLGTEDISFTLEQIAAQRGGSTASTGTGGAPSTISFSGLPAGDYRLVQQTPRTIALSYISQCTSTVRTFEYPFSPFAIIEPGGRLNIQLLPDEQLTCDWYNVQGAPAAAAALTLTAYDCSGDVLGPEICDLAPHVEFAITSPRTTQQLTTGPDGSVDFDGAGDYRIEAITELENRNFCAFEPADAVAAGTITLDPANPLALAAYYCYAGA